MVSETNPLYTLTIGEFMTLAKNIVNEVLSEKEKDKEELENERSKEEHFNIIELALFLKCSKVSVHQYKKRGLPFYRIGRKILFKKTEVLNFMKGLRNKRVI